MKRQVVKYGIYQHFKHKDNDEDHNNYRYVVMGVSKPVSLDVIKENHLQCKFNFLHTESNEMSQIMLLDGDYVHFEEVVAEELVIYKSLYDNHMPFGRPVDMFLSDVDKEAHPEATQTERLKLIGGICDNNWCREYEAIWEKK